MDNISLCSQVHFRKMVDEEEDMADMTYSAEQVERLLTCAICLERYTNPRILPCQHTFCRSPCLDGLVDLRNRKVKCPECRKEHYVPPTGAGGFPPNITVANFLDLPAQRGGPTQEPLTDSMCRVCESESSLQKCSHCDKMICEGCQRSHSGLLRKDVEKLLSQMKRGIPKLSNAISQLEQKTEQMQQQNETVKNEVKEQIDKYMKELKERQRLLHSELDTLLQGETRTIRMHQENLEVELASISSYCDSSESLLQQPATEISDVELKAMKKQCLGYAETLRKAENNTALPAVKRLKFRSNGRMLHQTIMAFGEATTEGSQPTQQRSPQRRRWDDSPQVERNFFESLPPNSPSPAQAPRRALSPPASWQSPREQVEARGSRSSTDYRHFLSNQLDTDPGNERPPARIADYLYNMGAGPDTILANISYLNDPVSQATRDRTRLVQALNAQERTGARMAALLSDHHAPENMNNNARSVMRTRPPVHPPVPPRPRRDPRPTEYYEIDLDGNPNQVSLPPAPRLNPRLIPRDRGEPQRNPSSAEAPAPPPSPPPPPPATDANVEPPTLRRNATFVRQEEDNALDPEAMDFIEQATESMETEQPEIDYQAKKNPVMKIGGERGSAEGQFKLPRGVAISPQDGTIVIADSSNHRAQVFDQHGQYVRTFGSYGDSDGEFDCLAGVAISQSGDVIIADRYNHRIQIFDSNFNFKLKFGSEGSSDGKFKYPWGVTVDHEGLVYVCDKENHRVQVFGADGTFLRRFGSTGNQPGKLENPYYITVGHDRNIYVSDTHNNRIQVFTSQGGFVNSFGGPGDQDGKFKHPKGITVDHNGFMVVADSGNHRIQVLRSDGTFFAKFGTKGRGEGQLRDPEGIAITPDGKILVADKDNYRILMF
ncbi:hypothetical protein CAPTEDRAFT_223323 [Capitella teleta]|uniref:RING-type domain-containing protein n=1 Tax=Capitella teleta TaxID=283909 RepID=R7UKL4_CAPTE|nr:hypothetical protein CAPTEDRAFT_223323 [Capitella teleta]|eukprot:ELU03822.1 hypothetical protein CAPTEDRAFT_223323 [Capitella teleta]